MSELWEGTLRRKGVVLRVWLVYSFATALQVEHVYIKSIMSEPAV